MKSNLIWTFYVNAEPLSLAKDFSSGYLLGEVLHKHQLQEDFHQFSKHRCALHFHTKQGHFLHFPHFPIHLLLNKHLIITPTLWKCRFCRIHLHLHWAGWWWILISSWLDWDVQLSHTHTDSFTPRGILVSTHQHVSRKCVETWERVEYVEWNFSTLFPELRIKHGLLELWRHNTILFLNLLLSRKIRHQKRRFSFEK